MREVPDYPKPGINFYDITPVLADPRGFAALIDRLSEPFIGRGVTKVAGIEARGFTLAAPVAEKLAAGFVPIRKPGKLPYEVLRSEYTLEYGSDALEMHVDAVDPRDVVLVVDDVIATGGTAAATARLVGRLGAEVAGFAFLVELSFLDGRSRLGDVPVTSLVTY